ncbi:MAG TPA: class I SAM-dependent rRNA methyltransferase [Bacteroidetes bacterium]|nr:class I SAM-dependent rRNA methyltransferase [Bacteroidota bacterium]
MSKRIAIKVKPAAERSIRNGHPWVFEGSIVKQSSGGQAGDTAIVFDKKNNKLLAVGLYDPASPIRIKLISFGKPATVGKAFFEQKIQQAFELRRPLLLTGTNSYRLVHGENDGLPGLVADVYAEVLVVKLYSPIWLPYLQNIFAILLKISNCKTLVLRLSRSLQNENLPKGWSDGSVVFGELEEEEVTFREHGLRFSANVVKGHKTGFFLDHRHNRKRIGGLAKGKAVLDVFSYAGGFSVHALAGGAREVTSLDISGQALQMAIKNAALNPHRGHHKTMKMDAFKGMEELRRSGKMFDVVVVDPPSFAKKESEVKGALNSYARLARLAVPLVKRGGVLLMASCSSRVGAGLFFETVEPEMESSGRKVELLEKTFHDVDHPVGFPEGAYLKAGFYRVA